MEEKREPLSEMAIERKIQILRNKHMDSEVIALVKSDYEYGLTDDEIGLYLNKSYDIEQMKVLSKCLHKGVSEELLTLLKDSRMAAPKMQTALDYYEKGVPIDAIREVVQKDDTAVNMRRMFDVVLEKLNKAMELLTEGKRKKPVDYSGPREFVDICDRFNIMVSKLEDSENQRKKLMNDKERMMADISHDLKTPITSIQGYAKALSDGIIVDEDKDKYIKIIYEKSKKLTELINIFHEYSKLEHPDFNLIFEKVDLSEYLRAYIALKYEDIVESGFNIEVDIPEEEMEIKIDKVQLQRVFDNILGNSIKHNEKGTNIYVSLKEKNDIYEIIIADDGKGISKDIANNIFEAFTVGDESRNSKQGSGLGLAIAKTIVELHEGTIELVLAPPKELSTEFKITLKKGPKL